MNFLSFFLVITSLGLFVACAQIDPHPMDMTAAEHGAETPADHMALARHYEAAGQAMQREAEAEKRELSEYIRHAPYYGRMTEDFKEHSRALIRVYEDAAEKNLRMAESHRRMAGKAAR